MSSKTLLKGSLILLITFNLFNLLNFIFQFSMARMLSLEDYGILAALFSIIYMLSTFTESVQTVITKASTNTSPGKIKTLLKQGFRKTTQLSTALFLFYLLASLALAPLLNIPYGLLALNGLMIFAGLAIPVTRGILQGRKQFSALGITMIIEGAVKLLLAIGLVLLGWQIYGAILATVAAVFIALLFSLTQLKDLKKTKPSSIKLKELYKYTTPIFTLTTIILIFYSIDIFMARALFPAEIAGAYALASILAKTIFFATQPISKAMFPITAGKEGNAQRIFTHAIYLLLAVLAAALILIGLFPGLIITLFAGRAILQASSIFFLLAIATSLISLANLTVLYKLSRGHTKNYKTMSIFLIIEILLLWKFSASLWQFSIAFIVSSAALLWGSTILLKEK
jgi:O-antigen/teichoic acid export membrane protein